MELKSLQLEQTSLKFAGDGHEFSGYASVFGGVDSYGDTVEPGAYAKTIEGRSRAIQLRWNHYGPVIGKWTEVKEDDHGLFMRGELTPGHSVAEDARALMKHGSVNGLSIGYRVVGSEQKGDILHLTEIDLLEVSIVESPADLAATIGDVKSAIEKAESLKEIESLLRDVGGFSRSQVQALVSRIKAVGQSDSDPKEMDAAAIAGVKTLFQHRKLF